MALLFADGFDHYDAGATGRANMLLGPYAEISPSLTPETTNPRTGTYSMKTAGVATSAKIRRVFGGAKTVVGLGGSFYVTNLPVANDRLALFQVADAANAVQVSVVLQSTGVIDVQSGGLGGSSFGSTSVPVISSAAYNHVEVRFSIGGSGAVEVRVNRATVLTVTGVDTNPTGLGEVSQCRIMQSASSAPTTGNSYVDDVFAWDDTGTSNNDFLGDQRVYLLAPDGDTATADWTLNGAASGYDCINDAAQDGDSTYIEAVNALDESLFSFANLPGGVAAVSALVLVQMLRKTEAGVSTHQASILSGVDELDGTDRELTTAYAYYQDIFPTDPATGAPWVPGDVDTAQFRLTRTT